MNLSYLALVPVACVMAACSVPTMAANEELAVEARDAYADLVEGRDDALIARLSSANSEAEVRVQLPMLRSFAPEGLPPKPTTTGWRSEVTTSGQRYALGQIYEYPDRSVTAQTVFLKEDGVRKIESFNINARMKPVGASGAASDEALIVVEE